MKQKLLRTLKLLTVRAILMHVYAFGEMNCVTINSISNSLLSLPSKLKIKNTVRLVSFQISFFAWDKTVTSFTFAFKIKTAFLLMNRAGYIKINYKLLTLILVLIGLTSLTLIQIYKSDNSLKNS
jgi:hypothetical protein